MPVTTSVLGVITKRDQPLSTVTTKLCHILPPCFIYSELKAGLYIYVRVHSWQGGFLQSGINFLKSIYNLHSSLFSQPRPVHYWFYYVTVRLDLMCYDVVVLIGMFTDYYNYTVSLTYSLCFSFVWSNSSSLCDLRNNATFVVRRP